MALTPESIPSIPFTIVLDSGRSVTLTDSERIILDRMRDTDGTEYAMVFKGPANGQEQQKYAPRDQVEPLFLKGLVSYLAGISGYGGWAVQLNDDGREVWRKLQHLHTEDRFEGLTEDELIDFAVQKCQPGTPVSMELAYELAEVIRTLHVRRKKSAPARARLGEYLRQMALLKDETEAKDVISSVRYDQYAGTAGVRLSDLRQVVPVLERDTRGAFYAEQERRLQVLMQKDGEKLPEKQQALLPCVAQGHLRSSHKLGYVLGETGCKTCGVMDGRTVNALVKKPFIGSRPIPGGYDYVLMIKKPE